jgi:hypothetical protein
MSMYFTTEFARSARFADPAVAGSAQQALAARTNDPQVFEGFALNNHLHPDAARVLISRRLPARVARLLALHVVRDNCLATALLAHERRDGVLAVLAAGTDDADIAALLVARGPACRTAIAGNPALPIDLRINAARNGAELWARLRVAGECTDDVLADDEIWSWMTSIESWPRRMSPRDDVSHILWLRPSLLERIDRDSPGPLVTAAAGSIRLHGEILQQRILDAASAHAVAKPQDKPWALLALVANPCVDPVKVLEHARNLPDLSYHVSQQAGYRNNRPAQRTTLDNAPADCLRWLSNRAFPGEYSTGRPGEVLELLNHPDISSHRRDVTDDLRQMLVTHPAWVRELRDALTRLDAGKSSAACPVEHNDLPELHGSPEEVTALDPDELITVLAKPIYLCGYREVLAVCQYGSERIGEDISRWETLWSLLPEIDSATALGELVDLAARL